MDLAIELFKSFALGVGEGYILVKVVGFIFSLIFNPRKPF